MEDDSSSEIYTPQVPQECIPKIGQEFLSITEAFNFYNGYAKEAGFSVRQNNSKKNKDTGEVTWKLFVCYKEGQTREPKTGDGVRNRGVVRVGCKAKLSIVKRQTGSKWIVSSFVENHNHGLTTPRKVHLLNSHRRVSAAKKALSKHLSEANIPTCQQLRLMEVESGGPEFVGCTERDIRNYKRDLREECKGIDAETLIEFFSMEKEKNPSFFFDFELDQDNKFVRCFWADAVGRRSYNFFSDVIIFYTTYNTNKYSMIFAPITGINHHRQTIVFGCGLLSDEKTESFVWLFKKWLEAMPGNPPLVIVTDQDAAMTKAIAQVLPTTHHHYFIWHILNKFSEKMNVVTHRDEYHRLKDVIMNSESPEEFQEQWVEVMTTSTLEDNDWLQNIFELRSKWVPAYVKHVFSAGVLSSQRAESCHSFFKRYISVKNSLMDFITRFNRALRNQRHNELEADHTDVTMQPKLRSFWQLEAQMAKIYTKKIFNIFQEEISQSHAYFVDQKFENELQALYTVFRTNASSTSRKRELNFNKSTKIVSCSCRQFQFQGIVCRHILAYFRVKQIFELPSEYILPRWTKSAKIGRVQDDYGGEIEDVHDRSLLRRHSKLAHLASIVVDDASLTDSGSNLLMKQLENVHCEIKKMNIGQAEQRTSSEGKNMNERRQCINDPSQVRAKGCSKRFKSSKEKAISKGRSCRGCGSNGHDKRNCPTLPERITISQRDQGSQDITEEDFVSIAGSNNIWGGDLSL